MLARHLIYLLLFTYNCCYALIDKPKITSYIINLDRSKDRLAYVQPRINALGYPVVRFPAVDGYNLTKETLSRVVSKNFYSYTGDYADLGTIGCALSHAKVWEKFLATDADYALIFEDDVYFSAAELQPILTELIKNHNMWDIVNLQVGHRGLPITAKKLASGYAIVHYLTKVTNAGAYLISRASAKKLLANAYPIRMPIDHYFLRGWDLDLKVVGVEPRLVFQKFGNSNIQTPVQIFIKHKNVQPNAWTLLWHELFKLHTYVAWFIHNLWNQLFT